MCTIEDKQMNSHIKTATIVLSNGIKMPMVGMGTYFGPKGEWTGGEVSQAVASAIDLGYPAIDTAASYGTESAVGEAIQSKIAEGRIQRKDLFLTTKLASTGLQPQYTQAFLEKSLASLCVDYIDLYLIHTPFGFIHPNDQSPNASATLDHSTDFIKTWKVMETFVKDGKVGSIGVSNFNARQLQRVLDNAEIKPVVNQIEVHPYFRNDRLVRYCQERGVQVIAYSPLGQPNLNGPAQVRSSWVSPLQNAVMLELAAKYNKTPAQLALRYQIQRNIVVIPMAADPIWQQENLDLLDFQLSAEDVDKITGLDKNDRALVFPSAKAHKEYGFDEEF